VVYAKPPFGGPQQVLKYLARYTHRVAISNRRLVGMDDQTVSFQWKDYANGNVSKVMTVDGVEFVRRFLQHVLPTGFVRIRHFGFLANRCRDEKLARCRALLGTPAAGVPTAGPRDEPPPEVVRAGVIDSDTDVAIKSPRCCPACGTGRMVVVEKIHRPTPGLVCSRTASDTS
jgi:hypothetical protein